MENHDLNRKRATGYFHMVCVCVCLLMLLYTSGICALYAMEKLGMNSWIEYFW